MSQNPSSGLEDLRCLSVTDFRVKVDGDGGLTSNGIKASILLQPEAMPSMVIPSIPVVIDLDGSHSTTHVQRGPHCSSPESSTSTSVGTVAFLPLMERAEPGIGVSEEPAPQEAQEVGVEALTAPLLDRIVRPSAQEPPSSFITIHIINMLKATPVLTTLPDLAISSAELRAGNPPKGSDIGWTVGQVYYLPCTFLVRVVIEACKYGTVEESGSGGEIERELSGSGRFGVKIATVFQIPEEHMSLCEGGGYTLVGCANEISFGAAGGVSEVSEFIPALNLQDEETRKFIFATRTHDSLTRKSCHFLLALVSTTPNDLQPTSSIALKDGPHSAFDKHFVACATPVPSCGETAFDKHFIQGSPPGSGLAHTSPASSSAALLNLPPLNLPPLNLPPLNLPPLNLPPTPRYPRPQGIPSSSPSSQLMTPRHSGRISRLNT
ncbi:hypothetical protein PQX77_018217 [Marasmius sp. AFHP31]|nr:hypothetical protein PQX77_018217 [Marasmius sp. AFHP31]